MLPLTYTRKANRFIHVSQDLTDLYNAIIRVHHKAPTLEKGRQRLSCSTVFTKLGAHNEFQFVHFQHPFGPGPFSEDVVWSGDVPGHVPDVHVLSNRALYRSIGIHNDIAV